MIRLINAGIRRYARSKIFYLALIATVIVALMNGYWAREWYIDSIYLTAQNVIYAIMVTWMVGCEHEEGMFRNKIIVGYTKCTILFSEIILAVVACFVLFLIHSVLFGMMNGYVFSVIPVNALIKVFISCFLSDMVFIIVAVTISGVLPHRAISAIACIICVMVMHGVGFSLGMIVTEPEDCEEIYYKSAKVVYDILPSGHSMDYMLFSTKYMGYENFEMENDQRYEEAYPDIIVMDDEDDRMINKNLFYSILMVTGLTIVGYNVFIKKDFK